LTHSLGNKQKAPYHLTVEVNGEVIFASRVTGTFKEALLEQGFKEFSEVSHTKNFQLSADAYQH